MFYLSHNIKNSGIYFLSPKSVEVFWAKNFRGFAGIILSELKGFHFLKGVDLYFCSLMKTAKFFFYTGINDKFL